MIKKHSYLVAALAAVLFVIGVSVAPVMAEDDERRGSEQEGKFLLACPSLKMTAKGVLVRYYKTKHFYFIGKKKSKKFPEGMDVTPCATAFLKPLKDEEPDEE